MPMDKDICVKCLGMRSLFPFKPDIRQFGILVCIWSHSVHTNTKTFSEIAHNENFVGIRNVPKKKKKKS